MNDPSTGDMLLGCELRHSSAPHGSDASATAANTTQTTTKNDVMPHDSTQARQLQVGFVTTGLYFDPTQAQNRARFDALSHGSAGEVFTVVFDPAWKDYRMSDYRVRALALPSWLGGYGIRRSVGRAIAYVAFIIGSAIRLRLSRQRPFDLLVSSDPFKSGLLAMVAGRILRIPYAVELNGNYAAAMAVEDGATHSVYMRMKAKLAATITPLVLKRAAALKLLYEEQLGEFATPELLKKTYVFHNLVPLDSFRNEPSEERYLLLLGHPWLLKGADLAIKAFKEVSERFPEYHLRIVGYCPNPEEFYKLAAGHPRIHLQPIGVPHSEAIGLVNRCYALLLPSRTEGMGRVLLEAMAASKPVVGARIDGIPRVIRPDFNGLLFESGNPHDLARQLEGLLANPDKARLLGENGWTDVHQRLSPAAYETAYLEFMRIAASKSNADNAAS